MKNHSFLANLRGEKEWYLEEIPKVIFSFSSKESEKIDFLLEKYYQYLSSSTILLSLFDIKHFYNLETIINSFNLSKEIVLDSGRYEANENNYRRFWDETAYIDTVNSLNEHLKYSSTQVYLVNYDTQDEISNQINKSIDFFSKVNGEFKRILLIHPEGFWNYENLKKMLRELENYEGEFDVIGLTESEMGENFLDNIVNIYNLRVMLNSDFKEYCPIHIFGTIDSRSIIFYTLAGADCFDGLNWLRGYYNRHTTYYNTEFYIDYLRDDVFSNDIVKHNIEYIKRLRNDLNYVLSTKDISNFKLEVQMISEIIGGA